MDEGEREAHEIELQDFQKDKRRNEIKQDANPCRYCPEFVIDQECVCWDCNGLTDLRDKLHRIKTWVEAYPIDIFPEPDFARAHRVLSQHGMSLDAISASNMRHVLKGIKNIIEGEK